MRSPASTWSTVWCGLPRRSLRVWEPEYLAHEIEHVLEQVDGVDLRRSARGGLEGVQETQSSVFETARAIAIGRVVAREVAQWGGDR